MTPRKHGMIGPKPKLYAKGTDLDRRDRGTVLMLFEGNRFTQDKEPPQWARKGLLGEAFPPQFVDDADWMANTKFVITMTGRLDGRSRLCIEEPTWPTRPDLRGAPLAIQAKFAPNLRYDGWAKDAEAEERLRDMEDEQATAGMTPEAKIAYYRSKGEG